MIYLIHCKNILKCYNIPTPSTTIKEGRKERRKEDFLIDTICQLFFFWGYLHFCGFLQPSGTSPCFFSSTSHYWEKTYVAWSLSTHIRGSQINIIAIITPSPSTGNLKIDITYSYSYFLLYAISSFSRNSSLSNFQGFFKYPINHR
jgi:hypothetical protein